MLGRGRDGAASAVVADLDADVLDLVLKGHGGPSAGAGVLQGVGKGLLDESVLLGAAGGTAGVLLGTAITYALANYNGWQPLIPPSAIGAGLPAAVAIGAVAGIYPALRAAHLSPTDALRTGL